MKNPRAMIRMDILPPSVNHAYLSVVKGKRVIRFLTKEAKSFKEQLNLMARMIFKRPIKKGVPVIVCVTFYFPNKRSSDLDNKLKMVLDGLNGAAYEDDKQVVRIEASKVFRKDRAGIELTVEEVKTLEEL